MIPIPRFLLKRILVISILACTSYNTEAQSVYVDSLRKELKISKADTNRVILLNELCWELALDDTEAGIEFGKAAISLSKKLNYSEGMSVGYYYLGSLYIQVGKYELALSETVKALSIDKEEENINGMASDHGQLGACHKSLGNYDQAAFHFYKSLEMFEKLGATYNAAQTKLNIANFSMSQQEYERAIKLANEAWIEFKKIEDNLMVARSIEMMALGYQKTGKWDKALSLFNAALKISIEEENKYNESEVLNNIGTIYHEKGDLDNALFYLNKSLILDDSLGRKLFQSITHANLALVYLDKNDEEKSIKHINESIAIGSEIGELSQVMSIMKFAADIYYANGNYKKAYEHYMIYDQINDTLFSEQKTERILSIQEKYETEKKKKEIMILKRERDAIRTKSQLVDTIIVFSIGTLLLLIVIVFFFFRQRRAKEHQRKIELEQKVLRAQMNPHFIFNSLNSIQRIFIEGDVDLANDYISDFGKLLRIIMENNRKDKISIQNEIETLKLYLDIEMIRLDGQINYRFDIDPNLDLLNNFVPPLIIQPFVENAIWHGILPKEKEEKGEILIQIHRESDDFIRCCIIDNGIGVAKSLAMKKNKNHDSKGISITQERLGGTIQFDEIETGGTKITLLIPLNS